MQYDYKKGGKLWALNQGQKKSLKLRENRTGVNEIIRKLQEIRHH
jgi:hypothetical protein